MMDSPAQLSYWRKGLKIQNFGDLLSELLFHAFKAPDGGGVSPVRDFDVVHLVGNVIVEWWIERDLEHVRGDGDRRIAYWGCGMRNATPLSPEALGACEFFGVRGPLTRDLLRLPEATPCADPGLLVPALYRPAPATGASRGTLCIPHFLERRADADLQQQTGVDRVLRPAIPPETTALLGFIDAIAGAGFVLAGALHAAIVAAAFRVPFAFFDSGNIDPPPLQVA